MRLHINIRFLFVLLCLTLLVPAMGEAATKAAVILGISDYPEASDIPDLQLAAQDAQNFSDFLKEHNYQLYTLVNGEATTANLKGSIDALARTAREESFDEVIFYFSGRGTRVLDERMPPDEDDGLDECLLLSDAKAAEVETYLRDDELLQLLARINAKVVLLILDCSFGADPEDASVKGLGASTGDELDGVNPMKEGDVETIQNALILSASKPDTGAVDGVLMEALLETLKTEEADTTGDRRLSIREIHEYMTNIPRVRGQTPQLFDPRQLNPILMVFPPLPTLQITSNPSGAEVFVTPVGRMARPLDVNRAARPFPPPDPEMRRRVWQTPLELELRKGKYRVAVQKSGFRRPAPQEIELTEYKKVYTLDPFTLRPISIRGTVLGPDENLVGNLIAQFEGDGKIMDRKQIGAGGIFHLSAEQDNWLQLDQEYRVTVTGRKVLRSDAPTFTFTGYEDIDLSISVALDTTPPELIRADFSASRTVPDNNVLLPGDDVSITIIADDDGLGLEAVSLELGQSGTEKRLLLQPEVSQGGSQESAKVYEFQYAIAEAPSAAEKWEVTQVELKDKGDNARLYHASEINIDFTVFPSALAMGENYFKERAYDKSLAAFALVKVQTDRSRYLTALAHYESKSTQKAIDGFLEIEDTRTYLGNRPADLPAMPRVLLNKLWSHYLDQLPQNRQNPDYLDRLAITAEALNRPDVAKRYRGYREALLTREKPKK